MVGWRSLALSIVLLGCGRTLPVDDDAGGPDGGRFDAMRFDARGDGAPPPTDAPIRPDAMPPIMDAEPPPPDVIVDPGCIDEDLFDQCANMSDISVLLDPMNDRQRTIYGPRGNQTPSEVAADCLIQCFVDPMACYLADRCERGLRLNECVTGNVPGLSFGCGSCFVRSLVCAADFCIAECAGGATSRSCIRCRCENGCVDEFTECSGLALNEDGFECR